MGKKVKKIHNRFDEWEILSMFTETAEDHLEQNYTWLQKHFLIKCVLGILLAVNAYLSHWGPWPWPKNYNYIVFSIIFYHIGSYVYEKLNTVKTSEGKMIGEYIIDGRKKTYHMKLTPEKQDYVIEEVDGVTKQILRRKSFDYLEYVAEDGTFLEAEFLQHFKAFLRQR